MLALGPRVEAGQTSLDTILDAAVVTGFEMQVIKFRYSSPVASIERRIPLKK